MLKDRQWFGLGTSLVCGFMLLGSAVAQDPNTIINGGFETVAENETTVPPWVFNSSGDAKLLVEKENQHSGGYCVQIDAVGKGKKNGQLFSNISQSMSAQPYRGKKIRMRGAVRTAELAGRASAQLWLRVDLTNDASGNPRTGGFDNMQDRPIRSADWQYFEIVLSVDKEAERLIAGMFILGNGRAWLDDVTLEIVDDDVPTTGSSTNASAVARPQISPELQAAFAQAHLAPQQPFFTPWLILPLIAVVLFAIAFTHWPSRGSWEQRSVAFRLISKLALGFTIGYWLLYFLPSPMTSLLEWIGVPASEWRQAAESWLVQLTAKQFFGIQETLVSPNGSGDTTWNYLAVLSFFCISLIVGGVAMIIPTSRARETITSDLLRSYLRYCLAAILLGYGLAKVSWETNQFPVNGPFQLDKTWGESSPMNVLWAFMGASRSYTIFGGLGEVVAALFLIWRRTALLGAVIALGVMVNVAMLNFCYDVPVKLFSSHLVIAGLLILLPDASRLWSFFIANAAVQPPDPGPWAVSPWRWVRLGLKSVVILGLFGWPVALHSWDLVRQIRDGVQAKPMGGEFDQEEYLLTRRGFRWINEVPFNR